MPNLIFNPETHQYIVDGIEYPSVTQVLKAAGLCNFDKVPAELLERAIAFGNAVHKAIELKCKGTLDFDSVDEAIVPYLEAWDDFVTKYKYVPHLYEQRRVNHALRIGYTIDNVGEFPSGSGLVDVKTGCPKPADIIQACAYGYVYPVKRLMVIYLKGKKFKVIEIKGADRRKGERLFLSCLSLYNFKKEEHLL